VLLAPRRRGDGPRPDAQRRRRRRVRPRPPQALWLSPPAHRGWLVGVIFSGD